MTRKHWAILLGLLAMFLVGSLALVVAVGVYLWQHFGPGAARAEPLPAITVEAAYRGANAQVVADTVAAPIEQQIIGVENMRYLTSRCTNDGAYQLTITFEPGVDLALAQVLVQNRVSLAQPILPNVVNAEGLRVRKASAGVLLFVTLFSPDASRDTFYLSSYATQQLKDELARTRGVSDVVLFGGREYAVRVWFDSQRLAAFDLTINQVYQALKNKKLEAGLAPTDPGAPAAPILEIRTMGRLAEVEQLENLVIKDAAPGSVVHLRDVARVELGARSADSQASLDGKSCVALGIYPMPGAGPLEVSAAVGERLAVLREQFPAGVESALVFDLSSTWTAPNRVDNSGHLLIDVEVPNSASPERIHQILQECDGLLRQSPAVEHVLTLTEHPFDTLTRQPCLLVRLAPAADREERQDEIAQLRRRLDADIPASRLRIRDLGAPRSGRLWSYPLDGVLSGPEPDQLKQWAEKVNERLARSADLTDVWVDPASRPQPQVLIEVDRTMAKDFGVPADALFDTLATFLGPVHVNDPGRFGRTWQIYVPIDKVREANRFEALKQLKVPYLHGQLVPLESLVSLRDIEAAAVIDRFNGEPAVALTANPAPGITTAWGRDFCEHVAEEVRMELHLPTQYRLAWR
jgi:multidrug efflux pump subunit AcrB